MELLNTITIYIAFIYISNPNSRLSVRLTLSNIELSQRKHSQHTSIPQTLENYLELSER